VLYSIELLCCMVHTCQSLQQRVCWPLYRTHYGRVANAVLTARQSRHARKLVASHRLLGVNDRHVMFVFVFVFVLWESHANIRQIEAVPCSFCCVNSPYLVNGVRATAWSPVRRRPWKLYRVGEILSTHPLFNFSQTSFSLFHLAIPFDPYFWLFSGSYLLNSTKMSRPVAIFLDAYGDLKSKYW